MQKIPIPSNSFELFRAQLNIWVKLCDINSDPECARAIEILDNALCSKIYKSIPKIAKNFRINEVRRFIAIFKKKYFDTTGIEFQVPFAGRENKIIEVLIGKLEKDEISCEEYLEWLFNDFFPKNTNMDVNIYISVSANIYQKFLFENSEKLKERKEKKKKEIVIDKILEKAKILYRDTKDKSIIDTINEYKNGKITIDILKNFIENFDKNKTE